MGEKVVELEPGPWSLPKLLSIDEVSSYLGLGKTITYEIIRKGELPHIRIRSRIRVSETDLMDYVCKNRVG